MLLRIDDTHDGAVSRRVFTFEWKTRLLTTTPDHKFTDPCADRIDRHHRFANRLKISIERLHNEQLPSVKGIILDGGDNCSDNARELHSVVVCSLFARFYLHG